MMKKLIYTMLFTLAGLVGMAQTNQPLPSGAVPFGATTYLSPSDSTIWLYKERDGTAVNLGSWPKVDSLNKTRQKAFALDVRDFGAVGDSSTINTGAFYDAFDFAVANGFKYVYVPTGTYLIDSLLVLPKDLSMFGDGYSSCLIPVGDTTRYLSPDVRGSVFMFNTGTETEIDNITAPIIKGAHFLKEAGLASSFRIGDVLKVVDTADFSFSGYRPEDKNGEYFTVYRVSADTIFLDHPFSDAYENLSSTVVYKPNLSVSSLSDIRVGHSAASPMVQRILFEKVGNTKFSNIHVTGARHWNMRVTGGYNIVLDRIYSQQVFPTMGTATQYGLEMGGVQNFIVSNSELFGIRHGISIANVIWGHEVLARFGTIYNCRLFSREQYGADTHGASSNITFDNNTMTGVQVRGRSHILSNNTIYSYPYGPGRAIKFAEIKQLDFRVINNRVFSRESFVQIEPVTVFSGNPGGSYQPDPGGVFKFAGNVLTGTKTDSSTVYNSAFTVDYPRSLLKDLEVSFEINDNVFINKNKVPQTFRIRGNNGFKIGSVHISDNKFRSSAISLSYTSNSVIQDNVFSESPWNAVAVLNSDTTSIIGNTAYSIVTQNAAPPTNQAFAIVFDVLVANVFGNTALNTGFATKSLDLRNIGTAILGANYFNNLQPSFTNVTNTRYPSDRQIKIEALNAPPSSASAAGTIGEIRFGSDGRIYICTGTNTWIRSEPLTTW